MKQRKYPFRAFLSYKPKTMKRLLLFYFLLTGLVLPAQAQATYFTFDSIWSPPYICQATAFNVEVFVTVADGSIHTTTQNHFLRNDTVYVQFHFGPGIGPAVPYPLHRQILVPAPPIGQHKVIVQGFYNGQLHRTRTTTLSVCATIANTKDPEPTELPVSVYPNPVSDLLTIDLPENPKEVTLTLTDATGKLCLRREEIAASNLKLDLKAFPEGVYFLKLETERGSV